MIKVKWYELKDFEDITDILSKADYKAGEVIESETEKHIPLSIMSLQGKILRKVVEGYYIYASEDSGIPRLIVYKDILYWLNLESNRVFKTTISNEIISLKRNWLVLLQIPLKFF